MVSIMEVEDTTYDDLFGDSEQVNIAAITAQPPAKGLARRLDELRTGGCCQKIAWSKSGCVAYVPPHGRGVNLRAFMRDPDTGKWDLGNDTPLNMPHSQDDFPIVHVSWSHLGTDLAVTDSAGRLMIFSIANVLDRMGPARAHIVDQEDEMGVVVGMHWLSILPHEKRNHIAWQASGRDDKWNFQIGTYMFNDAHHPVEGKASLIHVGKNGQVKLRFQQYDNSWQEVSTELQYMSSARETITHAAFASNSDNTLLLATYDVSGAIRLYRIKAQWNVPQQKQGQQQKHFPPPSIEATFLTSRGHCYPTALTSMEDLTGSSETKTPVAAHLTHFNFLPRTPDPNAKTVPTIQAVFLTPPNIVSYDQTEPQHGPYSIIARWEFEEAEKNLLHHSLDKVTSKKKSVSSVGPRGQYLLKRLDDFPVHSIVISFYPLWYNMIVAFCYSDGTIEFRNRSNMELHAPNYDPEVVANLSQAGFSFPALEPSLHVALSPNHCMAVGMQENGTIKLRTMGYSYGSLESEDDDPKHAAAIAALVLQSTNATNHYFSTDDIFAMMGEMTEKRKDHYVALFLNAININLDCGLDDNNNNYIMLLGRSPSLTKALSASHLLGLYGTIDRRYASKISWIILNLKYVTQVLTTIARMHGSLDRTPLRPEVVPQLIGICRWAMHFMTYMVDQLMAVGRAVQNVHQAAFDRPFLESKLKDLNSPVISILLSSFPRTMIKQWRAPLVWIIKSASLYISPQTPPETRRIYNPLSQALAEVPFVWESFQTIVTETQTLVRAAYKRAGMNESQRNEVEKELVLGKVPEVLIPVARTLLNEKLNGENALLDRIDPAKVMFFDTTWLGLTASNVDRNWHRTHIVDVCQKAVIRGTGALPLGSAALSASAPSSDLKIRRPNLRRCTRCGAYMEDVIAGTPGYSTHHVSWLMNVAKHCVCNNNWVLGEEKNETE